MDQIELQILNRRNSFRKQRNTIRRIVLLLFLVIFFGFTYRLFVSPSKSVVKIEIANNRMLQGSYFVDEISKQILSKNFFFINLAQISKDLVNFNPLLKKVVVRRYIIPEPRLLVFAEEKPVWGELKYNNGQKEIGFITNEGDLVSLQYLNHDAILRMLIPIELTQSKIPPKADFILLKSLADNLLKTYKLSIHKFLIGDKNELEVYTLSGLRIKMGKIDNDLFQRVKSLKEILNAIKYKSYEDAYLDLTLESGAVFKPIKSNTVKNLKESLFRKIKKH